MKLAVESALLDIENPRFEPVKSQREAVNALLGDEPSKLVALAEDIVRVGRLSPAEPLFVSNMGNGYVVLEGNRRTAALKLLANPSLSDDSAVSRRFAELAARGDFPTEIECVEFPDRESARHWIELRHTGNNGGVGVEPWNAVQKARFRGGRKNQASRGLQFVEAVLADFDNDKEIVELADRAKRRITNVGRLIGDPDVRNALGFSMGDSGVWWHHKLEATRTAIVRVLTDLGEKNVQAFLTKADRRDYIKSISASTPSKDDLLEEPIAAGGLSAATATESGKKGKHKRAGTRDERRIFENVKLRHVAPRTKRTLSQSHLVTFDQAPLVTGVMLRVVLELVLTEVGVANSWYAEGEKLHKKVVIAIRKLDPSFQDANAANPDLRAAYTISNVGQGGTAVLDLNSYVHHLKQDATADEVRSYSAKFGPLVQALDDFLGQAK